MQHSLLIFLVLIALGWSPTRMESLEFWGGQQHRGPSKELRIGGIFTEDQYQLDTIQVSSVVITFAGDKLYGTVQNIQQKTQQMYHSSKKSFLAVVILCPGENTEYFFRLPWI